MIVHNRKPKPENGRARQTEDVTFITPQNGMGIMKPVGGNRGRVRLLSVLARNI